LFAALAFFVFAQAASARNGAQSAADAAALAAAQDARDELMDRLGADIGTDEGWLDWLDGDLPNDAGAGAAAQELAAQNDSTVQGGAQPVMRDGQTVNIDPTDFEPDDLPDASVLFSVHLAE
jgi:hypothetical protein